MGAVRRGTHAGFWAEATMSPGPRARGDALLSLETEGYLRAIDRGHVLVVVIEALHAAAISYEKSSHKLG